MTTKYHSSLKLQRIATASRIVIAVALASASVGTAASAHAEQASNTGDQVVAAPSTAPQSASPALDNSNERDRVSPAPDDTQADIIVTAQKRVENVQDIPKAVDVVSQAQLTQAGVTNLQDLGRVSPSIQGVSAAPFSPPAIRGISSFALSIGVQTQTGIVLDDIPQPSFSTLANELTDVERVEILPGPQSTLSGRNAAGGLINIVTHNPTHEFEGTYNFEQTNDRQTRAGGFVSGPLTSTLGFSVSAFYNQWDGPLRNVAENGRRLGGFEQRGVRGKLQWNPIEPLTITLTGFYTKGSFEGVSILGNGPYVTGGNNPGSLFAPGTVAGLHPGAVVAHYTRDVSNPGHSESRNENKGGSARVDYDSGIGTLSSITSYSRNSQPRSDLFLGYQLFGTSIYATTDTQVKYATQEIRLASPSNMDRVQYLLGAIYTDTENFEPYVRTVLFPVDWDRTATVKSGAVYGRGTYKFVRDTSLTVGLRYQYDHQAYRFDFVDGSAPNSRGSNNYDFIAGEVSLQHDFTTDIKGYATYANAESGRAYDLEDSAGAATPAGLSPIPSQKVQNYELGLKTQWLDRRLTINLSAFRADYQNYQVQSTQVGATGQTPSIRLYAVGKVRSQGIELSSSLRASRLLRLGLDASYLDAKILEYPGAQCYIGQAAADGCANGVQNRRGMLPGTAKFRAVASANQTIPLSSLPFDGTLGALFRYQTRVQFDLLGSPNTIQGSYGVLNLTAGVRDRSGKYTAEFFVNNVTNQHSYASLAQDPLAPAVAIVGIPTRDSYRYFGGRFGLHF